MERHPYYDNAPYVTGEGGRVVFLCPVCDRRASRVGGGRSIRWECSKCDIQFDRRRKGPTHAKD